MRNIISLTIICFVVAVGLAGDNIYSASYLMLNPFAELDGLGGSCVSLSRGSASYQNNPALRDTTKRFGAVVSQTFHFEDERQSALAISGLYGDFSGALWTYLGTVSDIPYRETPTEEPLYLFNADQMYIGTSVNYTPVKSFTLGASVKLIHEKISTSTMNATAFDLGAQYRTKYASLGLSVRNIGDNVSFDEVLYELPMTYSAGISSQWRNFSGEFTLIKADLLDPDYNIALAYKPYKFLSFSTAFTIGHDSRLLSLGTVLSNWGFDLAYSVTPYQNGLGTRHSVSLGI